MADMFTIVFFVALLVCFCTQCYLVCRQVRHVRAHRGVVPNEFASQISLADHQRAADYTVAKAKTGLTELLLSLLLLLIWTLGGGLQWLDNRWQVYVNHISPVWLSVCFVLSILFISALLDIPMNWYRTFILEQRFGFNKTTLPLFFIDFLKQLLVSVLIGTPVLFIVMWLMQEVTSWWLYVWLVWLGLSLLFMWAYPVFIAPLFNQFRPLDNETLRIRIENLLVRNGFHSKGIFVMDGSARSTHGNAYFTGLGANKRIVFFDTLIDDLSHEEIEAVLAHELGHFKCGHISKRLITLAVVMLVGLCLLGYVSQTSWFYQGLGVQSSSSHQAFVLFMMLAPIVGFLTRPLLSSLSRKHEFEADNFATTQANPEHLVQALVKLYRENASTLTPEPLYSIFYDSHPPAPVRIGHLKATVS